MSEAATVGLRTSCVLSQTRYAGTFEKSRHGPRQFRKARVGGALPGDEQQVPPIRDVDRARQCAQTPLDLIADNGVANAAAHGESESAGVRAVAPSDQHEQRVRPTPTVSSRSSKIARLSQTAFSLHRRLAKASPRLQAR
tara:strand:- start:5369 stop:5788 length:420 start_codon:yes stop_codon:yes gene_type:complete